MRTSSAPSSPCDHACSRRVTSSGWPTIGLWAPVVFDHSTFYIGRSEGGWLAQLVRAPVSHTGGHRFESCAAHFRTRTWEVGTRNTGGEPFGPNELPLLFRVPRCHFRVRLLDAPRSRSLPHLSPTSAPGQVARIGSPWARGDRRHSAALARAVVRAADRRRVGAAGRPRGLSAPGERHGQQ